MNHALFERAYGCLMGVAVGDAMGMPSSLMTPQEIASQIGRIDRFLPAPRGHVIHDGLPAGSTTDDTAQTVAVARAIIGDGGKVMPESVAREILAWAESVGALDEGALVLGPSSRAALALLRAGVPPAEAGKSGETNGAPMRISPVGIIHPGDLDGAVADTELACLPTHGTSVAISGAAAISCAIACAVGGETSLENVVRAAIRGADLGAARGRLVAAPSIARRVEWAVDLALSARDESRACRDLYELVGTSVATAETVPAAIALFALAGGDPMKTAILAANTGGDCDTVGAIAGSVAGAFAGIAAFPSDVIETIERVNRLNLKAVAASLVETMGS
ncbi:MAG: ADP-ribosylglycohydrolase family protein [Betaproteobacteria bacterium]